MKKFFKDNLPKPEDIKKYKALGILGESIFEKQLWSINKHTLSRAIAIGSVSYTYLTLPTKRIV